MLEEKLQPKVFTIPKKTPEVNYSRPTKQNKEIIHNDDNNMTENQPSMVINISQHPCYQCPNKNTQKEWIQQTYLNIKDRQHLRMKKNNNNKRHSKKMDPLNKLELPF